MSCDPLRPISAHITGNSATRMHRLNKRTTLRVTGLHHHSPDDTRSQRIRLGGVAITDSVVASFPRPQLEESNQPIFPVQTRGLNSRLPERHRRPSDPDQPQNREAANDRTPSSTQQAQNPTVAETPQTPRPKTQDPRPADNHRDQDDTAIQGTYHRPAPPTLDATRTKPTPAFPKKT
jgi:hypothetical protein